MSKNLITLQNTPTLKGVASCSVAFENGDHTLKGTLYLPEGAEGPIPAVIVTGAWTTVKEQMAGTYARELAARGIAGLAFDFTGWGESEGDPSFCRRPSR